MGEIDRDAIIASLEKASTQRIEGVHTADASLLSESKAYWDSVPRMMFVLSGKREITYPCQEVRRTILLKPGMAVYCQPGSWFIAGMKKSCRYIGLRFGSEFMRIHTSRHPSPVGSAVDKWFHTTNAANENINCILDVILRSFSGKEPTQNILCGLCEAVTGFALEQIRNDTGKNKSRRMVMYEAINRYLHENFHLDIDRNSVARNFNMTPESISRIFSVCANVGFNQRLNSVRLENAARLLSEPSIQIAEIAYSCGYAQAGYFNRIFKKKFRMTPGEYRAKNLSNK